ncbi:hypothetical protein [uncultured Jatrophihabitans sp.]|uniref:hypothetical protein n=1 Tax=uncultured Jatrophihabitans sp. TaxID=1610747 RepID=UPI0035CAEBED
MTESGETKPAGEGISDEEMVKEVNDQTSSDMKWAEVSKREEDGTTTDTELAKADGDELS